MTTKRKRPSATAIKALTQDVRKLRLALIAVRFHNYGLDTNGNWRLFKDEASEKANWTSVMAIVDEALANTEIR